MGYQQWGASVDITYCLSLSVAVLYVELDFIDGLHFLCTLEGMCLQTVLFLPT